MENDAQRVYFWKMHGLGNDFVVINALNAILNHRSLPIPQLAHRQCGIGFDQMLIIEPSNQADYACHIYNGDGSEANQCGNGLRCVAPYLHEQNIEKKYHFTIETKGGIFPVSIQNYDHIRVEMGVPTTRLQTIDLKEQKALPITVVSVANDHAVLRVPLLEETPVVQLGKEISSHPLFSVGTNVGFMEVIDQKHIKLRVYERGAGETLACGSNACAAAASGIMNGWLSRQVKVTFRHGDLFVEWLDNHAPI